MEMKNETYRKWAFDLARAWRARIRTMVVSLLLRQARLSARMKGM